MSWRTAMSSAGNSAFSVLDLCGPWQFAVDLGRAGDGSYHRDDLDTTGWATVSLPCAFDDCAPGLERYQGVCWFRKDFFPGSLARRRAILRFEAVNYSAAVWVNGYPVGESSDGFLPFELDVTDALNVDSRNTIVVMVSNVRVPAQFPLFEGWLGQGGILREISLRLVPPVELRKVRIIAEPIREGGQFALTAIISNSRAEAVEVMAGLCIRTSSTAVIWEHTCAARSVHPGESVPITIKGEISSIAAWAPDTPVLYSAELAIFEDRRMLREARVSFGFRKVEVRNSRIFLNGNPCFLRGFNRHEDSPRTGMAVDLETARADFEHMKGLGANFVRLCHYPHHPGELDLCDEIGLLVMEEIPLNGWGLVDYHEGGFGWNPDDVPVVVESGKRHLTALVDRDINHPSITFWSVCNEPAEAAHPEIVSGIRELITQGKEIDSTRIWTHVSNNWSEPAEPDLFEADDVICVNGYPSLAQRLGHHGARDPEGARFLEGESLHDFSASRKFWRQNLRRLRSRFPGIPIVVTEFGYPSIQGQTGPMGEDIQTLATKAELETLLAMGEEILSGTVLWCYAKHPWPAGGFKPFSFITSPYGYVSRDRKTKMNALRIVEELFKR
jgi:beta-galactosidase/beta-glucuronidase